MKKRKISIVELGTGELAPLMNKSVRRITMMCNEGKLVARQHFRGSSWRIFLPEDDYHNLLEIQRLRVINKKG